LAAAAAAVVLLAVAGYLVLQSLWSAHTPVLSASNEKPETPAVVEVKPPPTPAVTAIRKLDVRIWKKEDVTKSLALADPNALPLREGDWMRIEAKITRPAYLYLIYLDAQGEATALFPWNKYSWENRPAEQKRDSLNFPEDPKVDGKPLEAGPSGIEAVLLLARDEPLSSQEARQLRQAFADVPPQGKFDALRGAVRLGEEVLFDNDRDRGRPNLDQSGKLLDPVERMRRLVRGELKKLGGDVQGVCYPFQGK
jgi:hypothetical protein